MEKVIIIPKEVTKKGDLVLISREKYERLVSIVKMIPKSQLWFWTKEWQKKEKKAEEDIKKRRIHGPFFSGEELLKSLKSK